MLDAFPKKPTHNELQIGANAAADRFGFFEPRPLPAICAVLRAPALTQMRGVSYGYPELGGWVVLGCVVAGLVADPSRNAGCVEGISGRV